MKELVKSMDEEKNGKQEKESSKATKIFFCDKLSGCQPCLYVRLIVKHYTLRQCV